LKADGSHARETFARLELSEARERVVPHADV
jgi:hypothetical protein